MCVFALFASADCDTKRAGVPGFAVGEITDTIDARELFRVGHGTNGDSVTFVDIHRVAIGPDGRTYVLDRRLAQVIVLDSRGEFVRTIGRAGQGPGEFSVPNGLGFIRDTLWVNDALQQTTSFFALDGTHIDSRRMSLIVDSARFRGAEMPIALLNDGSALFRPRPKIDLGLNELAPLIQVHPGHESRDTVLLQPAWDNAIPSPYGFIGFVPLAVFPMFSVGNHGDRIIVADTTANPSSDAHITVQIYVRDAAGNVTEKWLERYVRTPVPSHVRDSILGQVEARLQEASRRLPEVRRAIPDPARFVRDGVPVPSVLPPVFDIKATSDGDIWIKMHGTPSSTQWTRLQPDGRQSVIRFPPSFKLHDVHQKTAWGVMRDSLDVQLIAAFSMRD